jgi:signal transduction histidine kinase
MPLSLPIASRLARHAVLAMALNTAIAASLTTAGNDTFSQNMLYSQFIGLSIWALIDGGRHLMHPLGYLTVSRAIILTVVGSIVGYFLGSAAGDWVLGHELLIGWQVVPQRMAGFLLLSLAAGGGLVYFFMSREVLNQERSERELAQRQATEAQLKLLQSQLDPHMLFNTLANLRSLVPHHPDRAVEMIDQLSDFLRATLSASRAQEHSLQAEFDRLRDYLSLMQTRMGSRLNYALDLPSDLAQVPVPTLILQSIVENAIVHGLEPKVDGGTVQISASREGAQLVLRVKDDGLGFEPQAVQKQNASGFGLSQVRERLHGRYGPHATIDLVASSADVSSPAPGCLVTLHIPLAS